MTPELEQALKAVCAMKFPTVASLLRRKGYEYEAQQIEALVKAWEDFQRRGL
ncbi:MAG: hypothetical protein ABSG41_23000 [Bryobacteraceae bacterium]|jgi:hypothetical protein